ncbi:MAG: polysaccharide biosynthesis tyrosine autokinase, partial [Candidatus Neomarinimicrobiota bacterium]|nr:polysaccharide biosynthesis tyrosine autokinase [Candidatus Neomarinimicrobiota bacterium]
LVTLGLHDPQSEAPIQFTEDYSNDVGERFADALLGRLSANHRQGTDIIDISYTSVWPHESKLIVNTLIDVYKNFELQLSGEYAANSVEFLESLLTNQDLKLREAEKEFTLFKNRERMYDLDGIASGITGQVASIESEVYNTHAEINIRREKINLYKSKLSQDEKILAERLLNNINIQVLSLRTEIGKLESQLIQNIAQHGENHGAVKGLQMKLNGLKEQLNLKIKDLTEMGITVQDPLQARQDIVMELISLNSQITGFELKKNESEKLLNVYINKLNELPEKQLIFSRLQRNNMVLNQNYSLIRKKLEEAKINVAVQVGKVQIVDYAKLPGISGQNHNRTLLLGLIFGLGAGITLAFALEFLDNTIKSVDDVARNNLVVLGVIPSIGGPEKRKRRLFFNKSPFLSASGSQRGLRRRLMTREDPKSPVSEAYRSLRTSLLYSSSKKEPKSILISSAGPGEGKTTTVANLAITYANLGKKTLLVDTDLRRPVVHKVFELNREPGITTYLSAATDDYNSLIQNSEIENLSIITAGVIPPNPSELLGSDRMTNLVKQLENDWDIVLFDSPPLVAVTDATMISQEIDQIVMVVKVGQTDKKAFAHTLTNLRNVGAPLGGIIMNAVTHKSSYGSYYYYYYYQYYHYYGSNKES